MEDIEIATVHYKTPDFIYEQYESIRKFYPKIKYNIIDGSDNGEKYFLDLESKDSNITIKRFGFNIHHGPGMDFSIKNSNKKFTLLIDSDVTLKKPVIKEMFSKFTGYSVGKKIIVNSSGY